MLKTKTDITQKIHLIISISVVVPVSFLYAFFPDLLFELFPKTIDEFNVYKAIMGLYVAFSILWILGIYNSSLLKTALITNMLFMLGLGFGRLFSMIVDGIPTYNYVFGMVAELVLGAYSFWVLKRFNNPTEHLDRKP